MQHAIEVLRHSEAVLVKKLKAMKDGKPKWAASHKITELRNAISVLQQYEESDLAEDDLAIAFTLHPPKAEA